MVGVFVMLPLDAGLKGSKFSREKLKESLKMLNNSGITGVMVDMWWGVVESRPSEYNWEPYLDIVALV